MWVFCVPLQIKPLNPHAYIKSTCLLMFLFSASFLSGTPLHIAAKESRKVVIKFLLENGAFLADDINDTRFNPPLHYCPGLEWAYEIKRYIELEELASSSSESWMFLLVLMLDALYLWFYLLNLDNQHVISITMTARMTILVYLFFKLVFLIFVRFILLRYITNQIL